jgi:rubrerythrin
MADSAEEETEDDYWDDLATMYDDSEKHVIGDTTWFEDLDASDTSVEKPDEVKYLRQAQTKTPQASDAGNTLSKKALKKADLKNTDDLVETLEENEDEVECKECFDLFPKVDCIKVDLGYICPTCAGGGTVSENDVFKIDFPEYEKMSFGNDMIPEESVPVDEVPIETPVTTTPEEDIENNPISTPEEAVPFLVKDEEEAIAGYEQAAEVVEDSDLENKEEILDTIEHIKEEEEEHIEELSELSDDEVPADENDPVSEEEVSEEETESTEEPETEPVEEAVSDLQKELIDKLPKMTKTEFEALFNSPTEVKIFSGDPREEGIRGREYFVSKDDDGYEVYYMDETYMEEFTDPESEETFETLDDLWNFIQGMMENPDFSPEYNFLAESLRESFIRDAHPITEGLKGEELDEFFALCKKLGLNTGADLQNFCKENIGSAKDIMAALRAKATELEEQLFLDHGHDHIKSVAATVHNKVIKADPSARVGTHQSGTAFWVIASRAKASPKAMKELILDTLAEEGYVPDVVKFVDKNEVYAYFIDMIRVRAREVQETLHEKLTEATTDELNQIFKLCKEIGIKTGADLNRFVKDEVAEGQNLLDALKAYRADLGDDFEVVHETLTEGTEQYELNILVKDSINHLTNDLGKDPLANDFTEDVILDLEKNYDIEVPEEPGKYSDWCSAVAGEVSKQLNN